MTHLSTDVLIIGSGGAGLRAAIEARRYGVSVLLITKGTARFDCCTAAAMGSFRVSWEDKDIEEHFYETLNAGKHLNNPELVKILVVRAGPALRELETFGIRLCIEKGKASLIVSGQPAGVTLINILFNLARDMGVELIKKACAFNLLVEDGRCHGASAFRLDTGEIINISAKTVVLATGGFAGVYLRNDNPPGNIGTGILLAFQAGAKLQDLEFIQFQPMFIDKSVPRMPILDWLIEATKGIAPGGPLINNKGERFLGKYGLLNQKILRDNLIIAIEKEIAEEKEAQKFVALDLRELTSADIEKAFDSEFCRQLVRRFAHVFSSKPLHVASSAHYTMGGVIINEKCETTIEGLYAAGEVTGGIHGANRLGGNALTEIMVFGKIAGKEAAEFAINSNFIKIDKEQFGKGQEMIHELFGKNNKVEIPPSPIKREVKVTLSRFCGPLKSEESLLFALDKLRNLEKKIPYVYANDFKGLQDALESRFMILLSELVAWSALTRQESRGSHCRLDFPETDDKYWLKNIVIKKRDGEPEPFIEKKLSKTFIAQKSSMKLKLKERKVLIKRRVHS